MPADRTRSSSGRRLVLLALKLSVSVVLLTILLTRVDLGSLWASARNASRTWLLIAIGLYALSVVANTWRWHLLLRAQDVRLRRRTLLGSYLVGIFFNNFLPSNIGGDVMRIRDTAAPAGSKTLAATIVLVDRILGLMGLILVAAIGATLAGQEATHLDGVMWPVGLWAGFTAALVAMIPVVLSPERFGRLLKPLTLLHPEWVGKRIDTLIDALSRFRKRPGALASCFTGAVLGHMITVVYYLAVVDALHMPVTLWQLTVIVPVSLIVQMLPVSVNGFGIREAAFVFYFTGIGLPIQSAMLLSLVSTALAMLFSLSGAAVYVFRGRTLRTSATV
jgi:glycosyltransferase 2 family protein